MPVPDLPALFGLAALLGLKHGFDADHLAAIDGLARLQTHAGRTALARASGLLFSAGHGAVVVFAGLWLGGQADALPDWLDPVGSWLSIVFLATLGFMNLRAAMGHEPRVSQGLITPWLLRGALARHPAASVLVGALFAFSLDTWTGAAWFGAAGAQHGGAAVVLQLALVFAAGMVAADAVNGVWIAKLLDRSGRLYRPLARVFSSVVGAAALVVAGYGAARLVRPDLDAWATAHALQTGLALIGLIATSYAAVVVASRVLRNLQATQASVRL